MLIAFIFLSVWLISFIIMTSSLSVLKKQQDLIPCYGWRVVLCVHTLHSLCRAVETQASYVSWLLRMCEVVLVLLAMFCSLYIVSWKEIISCSAAQVCPTDV